MSGNPEPYDFNTARTNVDEASKAMKAAEQARVEASKTLAEKERTYRIALARKIVEVHAAGAAWTVAQDLARGDEKVADLRYERDVAKGVLDVAETVSWRHSADRKDLAALIAWSRQVAPDGQYEQRAVRAA